LPKLPAPALCSGVTHDAFSARVRVVAVVLPSDGYPDELRLAVAVLAEVESVSSPVATAEA
jgi:hypothetical protein